LCLTLLTETLEELLFRVALIIVKLFSARPPVFSSFDALQTNPGFCHQEECPLNFFWRRSTSFHASTASVPFRCRLMDHRCPKTIPFSFLTRRRFFFSNLVGRVNCFPMFSFSVPGNRPGRAPTSQVPPLIALLFFGRGAP